MVTAKTKLPMRIHLFNLNIHGLFIMGQFEKTSKKVAQGNPNIRSNCKLQIVPYIPGNGGLNVLVQFTHKGLNGLWSGIVIARENKGAIGHQATIAQGLFIGCRQCVTGRVRQTIGRN